MSANVIFGILLAGILSGNYAIVRFLGTGAVITNRRPVGQSLVLGLGTTVVMVLCALITWPINTYLLNAADYLQTMVFMAVVIGVVELLHVLFHKVLDDLCHADYVRFGINGAVLGMCIENTSLGFGESLVTALAVGIGFTVVLLLYSRLREAVWDEDAIPAPFRGLPISLLTAGMIALALLALKF